MVKKMRPSQCKGRWCQTHLFSMKPRLVLSDASLQETIRFCPKFNRQKKKLERTLPQLNLDGKIYTPLFILQEDMSLYASHDERNRQIFQDNRELQEYQISQIVRLDFDNSSELSFFLMMPRISSDRKHCKICKASYQEYQEHISSSDHQKALSQHPYSASIVELAQNFKLTKHQQKLNQHTPTITEPHNDSYIDSEMESALIEKETAPREKCAIFRKDDDDNDL